MRNYELEQELTKLEAEMRSLNSNLRAAIEAGDQEEIVRLKGRERDLPSELFSLRVLIAKGKVSELETELSSLYEKLREAKQDTKDYDLQVLPKAQIYREEAARLNSVSLAKLNYVKIVEREIQDKGREVSQAKEKLEGLLG